MNRKEKLKINKRQKVNYHISPLNSHFSHATSRISGITLVALVVTIVVLLILAGVTITALLGDDGILKKAENAANATNDAVQSELEGIGNLTDKMNEILGGNSGGGATLPTDGSFNETKGVNTPKLGTNMSLVKFDTKTQDWVVDETNSAYSYVDTSTSGNTNKSEWANAEVTVDGIKSYFVWIPRYAYKITYYTDENKTTTSETPTTYGTIDIKFLKGTGNTAEDGTVCKYADDSTLDTSVDYIIHPAFTNDVNYGGGFGNDNGTNDNGISGIWIGKYETADGSATTLKVQPGVASYRSETIKDMYTYALEYNTDLKSHMLKNSEWGAVAYLTESKYGRNGIEVTINSNGPTYYTGGGAEKAYIENTPQSSTGNVYGIYDLSENATEYVVAGYKNQSSIGTSSGSNEYGTVYTETSASTGYKYGDATYETSGWHSDNAYFVNSSKPFFGRGGYYGNGDNAGVFLYINENRSRLRHLLVSPCSSIVVLNAFAWS